MLKFQMVLTMICMVFLLGCSRKDRDDAVTGKPLPMARDIEERLAKLPEMEIDYDRSLLRPEEQKVMELLIEAARFMDEIFLRQVSEENPAIRKQLTALAQQSEAAQKSLKYFELMKGRWDRLRDNEPFLGPMLSEGAKPPGAAFYPTDMTREEFEGWIASHPEDRKSFLDLYTVIRRRDGKLVAIPYSQYYRQWLAPAAEKLRKAAAYTDNASLKNFLLKRAEAFLTNDYYDSDIAWVDVDAPIEVVIGPYEVYEDGLFNAKASFEAFITVVDREESEKLKVYLRHLDDMERSLPIADQYKNFRRGKGSTIKVVQEVFTAGDARRGIQTAAFNLPNDERIRQARGCKNVLLKNVMEAKFKTSGKPIAQMIIDFAQQNLISFAAYFNHTLFHELAHALGPGIIKGPDGKTQENRLYLKDLYSTIEECKADVVGIWTLLYALDRKIITDFSADDVFVTDVGLLFRSMRFGISEAHGGGAALEWNWYREQGAVIPSGPGRFRVDFAGFRKAVRSLANELLMIEATGDYDRAQRLVKKYAVSTPEIEQIISQLSDIPVDITPVFVAAGETIDRAANQSVRR